MDDVKRQISEMQKQISEMHTLLIRPARPHRGFVVRMIIAERKMEAHYAADHRDFRFIKIALIILAVAIGNLICGNLVMAWTVPLLKFIGF